MGSSVLIHDRGQENEARQAIGIPAHPAMPSHAQWGAGTYPAMPSGGQAHTQPYLTAKSAVLKIALYLPMGSILATSFAAERAACHRGRITHGLPQGQSVASEVRHYGQVHGMTLVGAVWCDDCTQVSVNCICPCRICELHTRDICQVHAVGICTPLQPGAFPKRSAARHLP